MVPWIQTCTPCSTIPNKMLKCYAITSKNVSHVKKLHNTSLHYTDSNDASAYKTDMYKKSYCLEIKLWFKWVNYQTEDCQHQRLQDSVYMFYLIGFLCNQSDVSPIALRMTKTLFGHSECNRHNKV